MIYATYKTQRMYKGTICKNLPFADGVFFRVETSVATAFKTNAISVIRGLNEQDRQIGIYQVIRTIHLQVFICLQHFKMQ